MNVPSATISHAAETIPWALDIPWPDAVHWRPCGAVSLGSILGISWWLPAVSGYVSRHRVRTPS